MKNIFLLSFLFISTAILAQQTDCEKNTIKYKNDECRKPSDASIKKVCGTIIINAPVKGEDQNYYSYMFEKDFWEMACADPKNDTPEEAAAKIRAMWEKYKTCFVCDQTANLLKFSLNKDRPSFIDTMVTNYDIDINFIDPVDNRNLFDYIKDKYDESVKLNGKNDPSSKIYKEYLELIVSLGGKTARKK